MLYKKLNQKMYLIVMVKTYIIHKNNFKLMLLKGFHYWICNKFYFLSLRYKRMPLKLISHHLDKRATKRPNVHSF